MLFGSILDLETTPRSYSVARVLLRPSSAPFYVGVVINAWSLRRICVGLHRCHECGSKVESLQPSSIFYGMFWRAALALPVNGFVLLDVGAPRTGTQSMFEAPAAERGAMDRGQTRPGRHGALGLNATSHRLLLGHKRRGVELWEHALAICLLQLLRTSNLQLPFRRWATR